LREMTRRPSGCRNAPPPRSFPAQTTHSVMPRCVMSQRERSQP
jgi:hypothetical protein